MEISVMVGGAEIFCVQSLFSNMLIWFYSCLLDI
jgi:hypothetical protein